MTGEADYVSEAQKHFSSSHMLKPSGDGLSQGMYPSDVAAIIFTSFCAIKGRNNLGMAEAAEVSKGRVMVSIGF